MKNNMPSGNAKQLELVKKRMLFGQTVLTKTSELWTKYFTGQDELDFFNQMHKLTTELYAFVIDEGTRAGFYKDDILKLYIDVVSELYKQASDQIYS